MLVPLVGVTGSSAAVLRATQPRAARMARGMHPCKPPSPSRCSQNCTAVFFIDNVPHCSGSGRAGSAVPAVAVAKEIGTCPEHASIGWKAIPDAGPTPTQPRSKFVWNETSHIHHKACMLGTERTVSECLAFRQTCHHNNKATHPVAVCCQCEQPGWACSAQLAGGTASACQVRAGSQPEGAVVRPAWRHPEKTERSSTRVVAPRNLTTTKPAAGKGNEHGQC